MKYALSELIDVEKSQRLLDSFCDAVGIAAAIIDFEGEVLVGSRWQQICTDFHRVNKQTREKCIECDQEIKSELKQGKRFLVYKCRNGLIVAASPIIIEGEHIAHTVVGQFLLETPDTTFFRRQAATYGFDEIRYLEALSKVPILSEEKLPAIIDFLTTFAEMLALMGLDKLQQLETVKAFLESEKRFRTLVEGSIQGILIHQKMKPLFVNQAYADIYGYTVDEILCKESILTHFASHEHLRLKGYMKARLQGKGAPTQYEYQGVKKDGSMIWVENRVREVDWWGESAIQMTIFDITKRKEAEDRIKQQSEFMNLVIESLTHPFYVIDASDYRIKLANSEAHLGNLSKETTCHAITHQSDKPCGSASNEHICPLETIKKTKKSLIVEHLHYDEDGNPRNVEIHAHPIFDSERNVSQIIEYSFDITEQKKLHLRLQQAEKMEAIGTLAGGVAHDLNNILSGVVSYPELMLLDLPENSPLRDPILTIKKSGERAVTIVQDLLTLARRGVAISDVVNLNHLISEQLESPEFNKLKSFNTDIQVEIHLEKDLLNIKGSTVHLSKTVMNLFFNAAEAMPDGGKISISSESIYIDRPVIGHDHVEEGEYVAVTVSDTGIGISTEDMEKIFEPFYTKKVMGRSGTGLGMAVVWGTVKDHDGYIDVESVQGEGTTFTLYFPATREEIESEKLPLSIEAYKGDGESILVVDDVEVQRELASKMLNRLGYNVIAVSSGEEAIDYLKHNVVDLMVLDMIMEPGIDGLETYKRIIENHPYQKAVIASGFSETTRVKAAQRLGTGQYIKKPYMLEKIGLAVKAELEKPSSGQQKRITKSVTQIHI